MALDFISENAIWFAIAAVATLMFVSLVLVLICRKCCKSNEKKEPEIVSLEFPLPPPTGEADDMDDTQYDVTVRAFREPEGAENGDGGVEKTEDYVPNVPAPKNKSKEAIEQATDQDKKVPCFLFEAPPPYDEVDSTARDASGDRRRMVSIKMPDLPVRKVGDTQILEARTAPTQSISYVLKTALSHSVVQPTTLEECHTQASTPSLHTAKKTIKNEPSTEGGELRQVLSLKSGFSSAESSQSKDTKENAKSTAILEKKAASAPAGSKESVQDSPKKI